MEATASKYSLTFLVEDLQSVGLHMFERVHVSQIMGWGWSSRALAAANSSSVSTPCIRRSLSSLICSPKVLLAAGCGCGSRCMTAPTTVGTTDDAASACWSAACSPACSPSLMPSTSACKALSIFWAVGRLQGRVHQMQGAHGRQMIEQQICDVARRVVLGSRQRRDRGFLGSSAAGATHSYGQSLLALILEVHLAAPLDLDVRLSITLVGERDRHVRVEPREHHCGPRLPTSSRQFRVKLDGRVGRLEHRVAALVRLLH